MSLYLRPPSTGLSRTYAAPTTSYASAAYAAPTASYIQSAPTASYVQSAPVTYAATPTASTASFISAPRTMAYSPTVTYAAPTPWGDLYAAPAVRYAPATAYAPRVTYAGRALPATTYSAAPLSSRVLGPVEVCYASREMMSPRNRIIEAPPTFVNEASMPNPLRIGATIPNFNLQTTKGDFMFHDWLTSDPTKPWTVFFSHPKDFTPVCTTELGKCHALSETFAKIGCKLIGVSCDPVEDHHAWSIDVLARENRPNDGSLNFPIIADADRKIVTELGMLDPEEIGPAGIPLPARALVILLGTVVKLTILYPATTGRDFDEVLRVITSLQLTANNGLATPVDWTYGERVIVGPPVKTEDAMAKFTGFQQENLPSGKPYLRSVDCPPGGQYAPNASGMEPRDLTPMPAGAPPARRILRPNPLRIGATIPNFDLMTTVGDFKFHDWLVSDPALPWTVFFSHPKDFTPVCTTELGKCHVLSETFAKIGCKLIGVSCDPVEDHHAWSIDVLARENRLYDEVLGFPIIADADRKIVTELGMLDPEEIGPAGIPLPARALVIMLGTVVKLTILYPATTGRNFDEVLRVVTSLQLTANNGLATPVNWTYGDRVIVGPPVKTEDAKAKFSGFQQENLPSGKPYLRSVDCPGAGKVSPVFGA